jgi:hypothetical protein
MTDSVANAIANLPNELLTGLEEWAGSVPAGAWTAIGGGVLAFVMRDTLFETQAVLSYQLRRAIAEARADREWNRLGSLSESEFDALINARNAWAEEKFRKADICQSAADEAVGTLGLPGRVKALRRRARKHMAAMHAINADTQRISELKARIESERSKQTVTINPIRIRKLMGALASESEAAAIGALTELNRLGSRINWESFVHDRMPSAVRERTLNILRRLAGTTSLGEARNCYAQYQQVLRANPVHA